MPPITSHRRKDSIQAISGQNSLAIFRALHHRRHSRSEPGGFIRSFQKELQARLAALSSGIQIMGIVVEGIHPPPQAAESYQGVQAATIRSVIRSLDRHRQIEREMKMAQVVANATRNDATAAAAERISQAKTDFTLFDGDRQAYAAGGPSFLFEQRLRRVDQGLANQPLIIMDHRIPGAATPLYSTCAETRKAKSSFGDPGAD